MTYLQLVQQGHTLHGLHVPPWGERAVLPVLGLQRVRLYARAHDDGYEAASGVVADDRVCGCLE